MDFGCACPRRVQNGATRMKNAKEDTDAEDWMTITSIYEDFEDLVEDTVAVAVSWLIRA